MAERHAGFVCVFVLPLVRSLVRLVGWLGKIHYCWPADKTGARLAAEKWLQVGAGAAVSAARPARRAGRSLGGPLASCAIGRIIMAAERNRPARGRRKKPPRQAICAGQEVPAGEQADGGTGGRRAIDSSGVIDTHAGRPT